MIFKENLNAAPQDKLEKAGYDAERKVAYYLKMAFGDEPKLLILHDLRVVFDDGITAQMDHLVIHEHGLIIIESKSVAGKLQVQDDGQWVRWYSQKLGKDVSIGMENPIKQASRQGKTLKKVLLLNASNDVTRNAIEELPVDVLVTFSTSNGGVFVTKNRNLYPEVCPADAIDDHVRNIISLRAANAQPNGFKLPEIIRTRLAEHLIKIHQPYIGNNTSSEKVYSKPSISKQAIHVAEKASEYAIPVKPVSTITLNEDGIKKTLLDKQSNLGHICNKCKSENVEVRFGRNYYLKCLNCDENNRIDTTCLKCKGTFKIRKDKKNFFAECSICETSEIFYINP